MSSQSEGSSLPTVDSSASKNEQDQVPNRADNEIVMKVGDISLEGDDKTNHKNDVPLVSTSVSKNDSSKDGILEGEEGELDYEEDEGEILDTSDNKQETSKKTTSTSKEQESDAEEGELEDGEVNSDGEEGEILSDQEEKDDHKKKNSKEEGEINEDDLEEGEVRDGDPYANQGRIPRKLCRYFVSGSCTWGVSCRFLHPGVNDKGAYHMLPQPGQYPVPYVRPPPPPPFPMMPDAAPAPGLPVATTDYQQPEDEDDPLGRPDTTDVKSAIPEKETAWERGIRLAKENKKAALRRKEEDTDFEQKRMLLSVSVDAEDEEGNKENQAKRQDVRGRNKKDDSDRGLRSSRWRDSSESSRYYNKDRDKRKRRSRRSPSSSPERGKYDRRRDEKESSKTSDKEQDTDKRRDRDKLRKSKTDNSNKEKKKEKDATSAERRSKEPSVSSSKDIEINSKPSQKNKSSRDSEKDSDKEEAGEGDKTKGKGYFSISENRLANDDWHDPWQRTTSPKRRSPRRRSTTSSYSSRSRSTSSSSGSSRSSRSRSRSRTLSSTGSESRSSSRSVSRSPSRSPSQTPSETSSRSMSRSGTHSSESDRSSASSRASPRKDRYTSKTSSNKAASRNQSMSRSGTDSESPSESDSDSERSRSPSSSPNRPSPSPPPPPRSPSTRAPKASPPGTQTDRSARYRKDRYELEHRGERVDKYRQSHVMGWDRRDKNPYPNPYSRGATSGRVNQGKDRGNQRRRRSKTPPVRRETDQRRVFEEAPQQGHADNSTNTRPPSPRSRDHYNRRGTHSDNSRTSSDGSGNNVQGKSTRSSNVPSNDWSAERRKQPQSAWMGSGSVRYTGHKDIKLTLNKSAGKAPSSSQSSSSRQPQHSPPRQAEASSSSSASSKDPDSLQKKRWPRPAEPEISQRHSSPRDDVTSSQAASKPIKRAADSVLTPRHETQSNRRSVDEATSKRADDKRTESRPLKRSADSAAANPKRTLPENVPSKQSRESLETPDKNASHVSNTSRREELLRELKAVEDAIARKRARIE